MDKKARHESRSLAVKVLFSYLERGSEIPMKQCLSHVLHEVDGKHDEDKFAGDLLHIVETDHKKIKLLIRSFASEFSFDKIAPINRCILILGIAEMKHFDTPPIVVINEYIELAKEFGEVKSASFVNAVLDAFRKNIETTEEEAESDADADTDTDASEETSSKGSSKSKSPKK